MTAGPRIAYILSAFPTITETFNLREILQLQRFGAVIEIFSLRNPEKTTVSHLEARTLYGRTHYCPWLFSWPLISSNLKTFLRFPWRYLRLLGSLIIKSARNPVLLIKTILIFPKSVHFACIAEAAGMQHIHATFASHPATCALIMSSLTGIQYSVTIDAYDLFKETELHPLKLSRASFASTISAFNFRIIQERYGNPIVSFTHVIRRGVDLEKYRPTTRPSATRDDSTFRILCVASLTLKKGHRYLLEALHHLLTYGRGDFHCVIVGDGPLRKSLKRQSKALGLTELVTFTGNQTQDEVLRWLHCADCFVLPSIIAHGNRMEGIPNVLMEAMACCLPVVSTRISGIPELVEDHKNGLLISPEDPKALSEAIAFLQDNPIIAKDFGLAGREKVRKEFNLVANISKLWELYEKVIQEGRNI